MAHSNAGLTLPSTHDCCCEHVVDRFQAMPGPREEVLAVARRQLQDCPHAEAGNLLEMLVVELREATAD
jgi:hypothetical protein